MAYLFTRAVVIGSGTMGAAIAAHLANAGLTVSLLDIVPDRLTAEEESKGLSLQEKGVRNRIVQQGLERAIKARPAAFFSEQQQRLVSTGNLEDDFDVVASADWIIEVIVENLAIKQKLMARIDDVRQPQAIVSTNTSGLSIAAIAEGRSASFRQHFLGTHFFNPVRYLKLLELIPTPDTRPEVIQAVARFCELRMGKGIVHCKDTPNFIGNRIGFGTGAFALDYILKNGFTVEEVDALSGPLVGRPKTATFRLIDLVGIDVWEHVGSNLAPAIPHDQYVQPYLNSARSNRLIHSMVERGWLGNKSKQGFYKEVRSADGNREFWTLNLSTLEYEAPQKVRFESVGKARDKARLAERLKIMLAESDRAAALVQAMTYQGFAYASHTIPEIADTPLPIDDAMRWGYGHEAGPFEIWDALGVRPTSEQMRQAGFPPATWVDQMLASGIDCFYLMEGERKVAVYNPRDGKYQALPRPAMIILKEEKSAGKVLKRNAGASLVDLGDGVPCVEFHTKMNSLDDDIFNIVSYALDAVADGYEGLVIGSQAEHFSAGANVGMIALAATNGLWEQIDNVLKKMQNLLMRMRYFPKPVVVAPYGYTLGGGAEVTMHAGRIVAACETYAGLVEVGIGVIPAGGGTKEIVRRVISPPMRTKDAAVLPYLQRAFEQIGMAKVATSAEEARQMGILGAHDRIVMNRDYQISEAKREVLHLAQSGYQPPVPEQVYAAGRDALAALRVGIYMMKEGRYLTEYEQVIGEKLAYVLTGGELSRPTWVDEQYLLDLEREAFLSLCGEKKSQERMWTFLQTGKAIRN